MQRVLVIMLFSWTFSASAGDTVLKLYRPFGAVVEQVAPSVKQTVSGHCFSQSRLIIREDAWRCMAEGKTYDPCFVQNSGKKMEVICPQSPWVGDSVQILLNSPLNSENNILLDMSKAFPWGIELANGDLCQAIDFNQTYDGMPIRYHCMSNNVLVGYLQRCKPVWRMLEKTPAGVQTVEFNRAWF